MTFIISIYGSRKSKSIPKNVQVHHIKKVSTILRQNDIYSVDDAKKCEELWDKTNVAVITKGEHYIFSRFELHKTFSKGFKRTIAHWVKEQKKTGERF